MQDIQQQQMFSYIFTQMMPTKFGSLKLGIAFGLFNCTYKTLYLKYKSNFGFSVFKMSLVVQNNQNNLENAHISSKVNDIGHNFHV